MKTEYEKSSRLHLLFFEMKNGAIFVINKLFLWSKYWNFCLSELLVYIMKIKFDQSCGSWEYIGATAVTKNNNVSTC